MLSRNRLWERFAATVTEAITLQSRLTRLQAEQEEVAQLFAEKKAVVETITGMTWDDVIKIADGAPISGKRTSKPKKGQGKPAKQGKSGEKNSSKNKTLEDSLSGKVLKAVAHYVDDNPQSRITAKAIKIFLNSEDPDWLKGRNTNAPYNVLHSLSKAKLLDKKKEGKNETEYTLTAEGRKVLSGFQGKTEEKGK